MNTNATVNISSTQHNIFALYRDSEGFVIIVRPFCQPMERLEISEESGLAILTAACRDEMIIDSEGYDEDPSAMIWWLHFNSYRKVMTAEDEAALSMIHAKALAAYRPSGQIWNDGRRQSANGRFVSTKKPWRR